MAAKARRGVAILDIPDLAHEETLALRYRIAGGKEEYEKGRIREALRRTRPTVLRPRLVVEALRNAGATSVAIRDQEIRGYANAAANVFAQLI